ncbi:hypothetical protein GUJ93_ZPchr0010g9421 [Zizania palustris]|uniref:Uncharacterized protein n=1 Tax=Zizania palustris TaxID=103762 RepID=A0A8J6BHH3_ZIZPA|nr:hypothetical protein GUJ93_ZPchr0010g9421 [Zizania palustris]
MHSYNDDIGVIGPVFSSLNLDDCYWILMQTCPLLLRVFTKVGSTFSYGHGRGDDAKTLAELGFQIGDYLSVAIY